MGGDVGAAHGETQGARPVRAGAQTLDDPLLFAGASLVVEHASADAVAVLRSAGIRAILLKGPPQQEWLAPAGPSRASVDVDLLVDPDTAKAAGHVFAELGYRLTLEVTPGVGHHATVWSASGRVPVEVHYRLWGAVGDAWPVLERETETVKLAGESVEVPNEPARCLVVALHAAHHGVGKYASKYDLERALDIAERSAWDRAAQLARAIGAEAAFAGGLGLVPAGEQLPRELGLDETPLDDALALEIATPTSGAPGYYWLTRQRGVQARTRFILRKLVPPAGFMRYKHRWARRGRGHLLLAYAYRPVWLARWTIPGLLEWRRIRGAARASGRKRESG